MKKTVLQPFSKIFPLVLLSALLFFPLNGQVQFQATEVRKSDNIIMEKGKNYFLHEIQKGHTLYSIAKAYGVSEEDILSINPSIQDKPLPVGQVIRIPASTQIPKRTALDNRYLIHEVKPKETLSALSRQYGVRIDDIREANPEITGGLIIGQQVRIPRSKITLAQPDKPIQEANPDQGTTISDGRSPGDEQNKPCRTKAFIHKNDLFDLAILLPLNVEQNDNLPFSDTLDPDYFRFYEFLEGTYMALDSLRQAGLNLSLSVFDTERNPETIRKIIKSGQLSQVDLIIGPVFRSELEVVAPFANSRQIPLVNPLSSYDLSHGNRFVFQARLNPDLQISEAINYLASQYSSNMVIVGRMAEKNQPDFQRFYQQMVEEVKEADPAHKASPRLVYFNEIGRDFLTPESARTSIDAYLKKTVPNFVIIPSNDEVFSTELVNQLNTRSAWYSLSVFGLYQEAFTSHSLENLFNINLELMADLESYPFVDYQDSTVQEFCRAYRDQWNTEPSRYSFQGFDLAYYFGSALLNFGRNLTASVPCWDEVLPHRAFQTPLRFSSTGDGNGFENLAAPVVRFRREDLVRKRVN